jgi:hypothetical protein
MYLILFLSCSAFADCSSCRLVAAGFSDAPSLVPSGAPSDVPSLLPSTIPSAPTAAAAAVGAPSLLPSVEPRSDAEPLPLPLSDAPSLVPSSAPSQPTLTLLSDAPSLLPSTVPSAALPTDPANITDAAPDEAACDGTSLWAYEPSKQSGSMRTIQNNTATCVTAPYNLEVRPCDATLASGTTVQVRIVKASKQGGGRQLVHRSGLHRQSPFYLYGPSAATADGTPKRVAGPQLPNGVYYVSTSRGDAWGRLVFTQRCQ